MREVRAWWQRLMNSWRRRAPEPEVVQLQEIEQELQTTALEEQTAQVVAQVSHIIPSIDTKQAEREAWDLTIRRRSLEAERDVLLRRHRHRAQS